MTRNVTCYSGMDFTPRIVRCSSAGFAPRTPISDQGYTSPSDRCSVLHAPSFLKSQETYSGSFGTPWNSTRYLEGLMITNVTPSMGLHFQDTERKNSCKI